MSQIRPVTGAIVTATRRSIRAPDTTLMEKQDKLAAIDTLTTAVPNEEPGHTRGPPLNAMYSNAEGLMRDQCPGMKRAG